MEGVMLPVHSRLAAQWTSRSAALRTSSTGISRRSLVAFTAFVGLISSPASVGAQTATKSAGTTADRWQPWVLSSTADVQTAPPSDPASELPQVQSLAKQRDAGTLE